MADVNSAASQLKSITPQARAAQSGVQDMANTARPVRSPGIKPAASSGYSISNIVSGAGAGAGTGQASTVNANAAGGTTVAAPKPIDIEAQYKQRQAEAQKTYDTRQAENQALFNQRQAAAQSQYDQRNADAQTEYNKRLGESQGQINDLYGKALEAQKLQYKTALDKGIAAQEEARAGIAQSYQTSANDLAVQYERNKRNLNMQALAYGLNTGTGSQQQLALNQGYMGAYGKLRGEESAQNAGIDRAIANLKVDYENGIAQALADNDYKKAAALMDDYNNKQSWLDAQRMNNQGRLDTLTDNNQSRFDSYNLSNQDRLDKMSDNNLDWSDNERRYQDEMSMQKAETLASYGDFSGYAALYGAEAARNMEFMWRAQNPELAAQIDAMKNPAPAGLGGLGDLGGGYFDQATWDANVGAFIHDKDNKNVSGNSGLKGKGTSSQPKTDNWQNIPMANGTYYTAPYNSSSSSGATKKKG